MAAGESTKGESRIKGNDSIREILKKAVDENTEDNETDKKKKKSKKRILERIKSGEDLLKDQDDNTELNTYNPEEKNVKKRKDKSRKGLVEGVENPTYQNDEIEAEEKPKPTARPRKSRKETLENDSPMTIDELTTTPRKEKQKRKTKSQSPAPPEDTIEPAPLDDTNNDTKKKTKKDKKSKKTKEDEPLIEQTKEETKPEETTSKKKKKKKGSEDELDETKDAKEQTTSKKNKKKKGSEDELDETKDAKEQTTSKKNKKKKGSEDELDETKDAKEQSDTVEKKKKSPKKKKMKESEDELEGTKEEPAVAEVTEEPAPEEVVADDGRVMGITVHRTDKLVPDLAVSHPLVKVSVVDLNSGRYVQKQTLERPVTSFYESSQHRQVQNILPIMTQPYDYKARRSVIPDWNEMVLFNENCNYFTGEKPQVVVFFELVDFVSMNQATERYARAREDGGWHRIAWAFLKIRGANGILNTDKRTRLQLFYCPDRFKPQAECPDVYTWWKYYPRDPYPSTLYVTVKSVIPPQAVQPASRSMIATQAELGTTTYKELRKSLRSSQKDRTLAKKAPAALWGRLPGQMCKIPNSLNMVLPGGRKGCYVVKFSHDGRLLACGCHDRQEYTIMLYEIPSGKLKVTLTGHYGLIYDLCWSHDDLYLVSGSGDGTARVWEAETLEDVTFKLLPHPSFVYTSQFHSRESRIVATGGYDGLIRVWDISVPGQNGQLVQEIDYHQGHLNSLCFDQEGGRLYTADNLGTLVVWLVHVTENPNKPPFLRDWSLYQEIRDEELKGTPISDIKVFYGDRRLLIQSRDNTIRMLDLRVFSITQRYLGSLNFREHIHSTVTPCGTFVMAGSEDHVAYVWNAETGDQVAMYDELNYMSAVTDVDYHPHEHMAAFCSYGDNQPVLIYTFDPKLAKQTHAATVTPAQGKPPTKRLDDPLTTSIRQDPASFSTYDSTRYSKVMQKLGTVVSAAEAFRSTLDQRAQSSWNSRTMDSSVMTNGRAWRPEFSSVGRLSRPAEQISINLDNTQGQPQFTFKSKEKDELELPKCVVLYDYKAARSDELDMMAGETVTILYKDNDNWWMGQLGSRQGYFPASYVEEQRPEDELEALSASSEDDEVKTKKKMNDLLAEETISSSLRKRRDSTGSNYSGRSAARQRRHSRQMESTA